MKASAAWNGKMAFRTAVREHSFGMDTSRLFGGDDGAPSPKELVLSGLIGCTGMDVVSLLRKSKAALAALEIEAEASQTKTHPAVFDAINLVYKVMGAIEPDEVRKAVELSSSRYCGVMAMLGKTAKIRYEILLNGASIASGEHQPQT